MKLNLEKMPQHIAFIMDGNGRWATKKAMPRKFGHKVGAERLEKIVEYCFDIGIKIVSCFAFSTENWQRPKEEIDYIFSLLKEYIKKQKSKKQELKQRNIKIKLLGDLQKLPDDLKSELEEIEKETSDCDMFVLNIAINYGGRDDIVNACNKLLEMGKKSITEQDLHDCLYTGNLHDPDFIVRTAGDVRLSNFMLFQSAYSELYFTKTLWPDFQPKHLDKALKNYAKRTRKFGQIKGTTYDER